MDSDALIQKAKERNPKALDMIYRTYYPKMVGVCMNIIREDRATANDLVHDAFVLAFASIGNLRDNSKLNEWLTTIVRNVSLQYVRQEERLRTLPITSVNEEDAVFIDTQSSPDSDLNYRELLALIDQLPEGYSKILRLSVIEGFSHREIADMLGIEPHSSSSQLSRAKRLLRRMIEHRTAGIIALLILPLACYFLSRHGRERHESEVIVEVSHGGLTEPKMEKDMLGAQHDSSVAVPSPTAAPSQTLLYREDVECIDLTESDIINSLPTKKGQDEGLFVGGDSDTGEKADTLDTDSIVQMNILPEIDVNIAVGNVQKSGKRIWKKWQFLAAGSLGPGLAQSAYRLMATNSSGVTSGDQEPEGDGLAIPEQIRTWEEYSRYLKAVASPYASADTLELIEIAEQNTGEIVQREHHEKPVTFGISLTKSITDRWSIETGLQYNLLRSTFTLGEGGNTIVNKQKVHYLGLPLRMSYRWMGYKRLSAYSSVGMTMHFPVYSKVSGAYYNDWQRVFSDSMHVSASVQWQVEAGIGVQYKFAPHISLFAEPTLNWFVPLGSEMHTVWTEHPFVFTLPIGVRITW